MFSLTVQKHPRKQTSFRAAVQISAQSLCSAGTKIAQVPGQKVGSSSCGRLSHSINAEHAWLHFAIRLLIVLFTLFLIVVFAENSLGQSRPRELTREEIQQAEQRLSDLGYWTGPVDGGLRQRF